MKTHHNKLNIPIKHVLAIVDGNITTIHVEVCPILYKNEWYRKNKASIGSNEKKNQCHHFLDIPSQGA
jgi:hypothetical protein